MLKAFVNAFKIPDLRKKILFTLFVIAIFRLGSHVPVPVVDIGRLQRQLGHNQGNFLTFINLFSGGALTNMAVFALGIMPYITSSIIMQLLTVVIPKLEQWQKQGEIGIKKITQATRYMTVVLALLQSTGLVFLFHSQSSALNGIDIFPPGTFDAPHIALIVLTLTAGTALIMWLGELITQRGIGNGMSILIFASIISRLPAEGGAILKQGGGAKFVAILLIGLGIIVAVVYIEQAQRRIPVQYAKRVVGRRMTTGGSTYIPLKVNQAGVIPIIFASSVLYFPSLLASVVHVSWFQNFVTNWKLEARAEAKLETIDLQARFNDRVGQIFRNRYVSPRSPFCSLAMPSQGIGGLPLNTCIETCLTCLHGIEDSIIDFTHTRLTGFTNTNGTSHIGAIALITSAHVNGDEFPALDTPLAGVGMGHRAIRARGYNRFKRRAICA